MKKKNDLILICSATALLLLLSVGTLLSPDVAFSENENRYLQEKPTLSADAVLSGRFSTQMESYLSDQILGREGWVEGKSLIEAALGVADSNGVYLCKDGRVVERVTETQFNHTQYAANLQQVAELKENCEKDGIALDVMLVPTAAYIYKESLPAHALTFDEDRAFGQAETLLSDSLIDLRTPLLTAEEKTADGQKADTYFRTDHHWTGYGAFLGYKAYLHHLGVEIGSYGDTEPVTLTEQFKGTLYSKVLLPTLAEDTIQTPLNAREAKLKVCIVDGNEENTYDSLYFDEFLKKKDKYAVFFGGNYAQVEIKTDATGSKATQKGEKYGEKLLIVKDSFANSFVPYLLDDFAEITMVDTRYFRGNISELAGKYDRVLVLYSLHNFAAERMNLTQALLQ